MFKIYFFGALTSLLCLLSNTIKSSSTSSSQIYDSDSSKIYDSMRSYEYLFYLVAGCGICIPIFIELVIDVAYTSTFRLKYFHTIIQLGLALASLGIVNFVILVWIIPYNHAEYLGSISAVRTILYFTATLAHLKNCGGYIFQSNMMYVFGVFGFLGPCLRAYGSVFSSEELQVAVIVVDVIFIFITVVKYIQWIIMIREIHRLEWTLEQLSCSVYLTSLFFSVLWQNVINHGLNFNVNPSSTPNALFTDAVASGIFVVVISILTGRIARQKTVQTEVNSFDSSHTTTDVLYFYLIVIV